jgi:hypothetical protein
VTWVAVRAGSDASERPTSLPSAGSSLSCELDHDSDSGAVSYCPRRAVEAPVSSPGDSCISSSASSACATPATSAARPIDYFTYNHPATAGAAVGDLDAGYARWVDGVRSLGEDGLNRPVGEAEGAFAAHPYASLVTHIHREVIHHGAEISATA